MKNRQPNDISGFIPVGTFKDNMSEFNPYHAPQSKLVMDRSIELASRGSRLGASLLDSFIILIPLCLLFGIGVVFFHWNLMVLAQGQNQMAFSLVAGLLGASCYFAVNGSLLKLSGQTIGKKICGIQILKLDGSLPSLQDSFFKRYVLIVFSQQLPVIGLLIPIIDALMIFRENHKCLHDEIAQTMVVKVR